jgi:hypothetical protein
MMGVTAHKASEKTREAANAAVERAEAALRTAQDKVQGASGQARPLGLMIGSVSAALIHAYVKCP